MSKKILPLSLVSMAALLVLVSCGGGSSATIARMKKEKMVRAGTVLFQPPFMYQKGEDFTGADAKIGEQIQKKLNEEVMADEPGKSLELRWIPRQHSTVGAAVANGENDFAIGVLGETDALKDSVQFSHTYYKSELVLIINPLHRKDLRPNTLSGAKIGVREGTAIQELVNAKYSGNTIVPYQTLDDAVLALKRAEIDAVIDDKYMAAYSLDTVPGVQPLEIVPNSSQDVIGLIPCAVAVGKKDDQLLKWVNEVIDQVNQQKLYATWLNEAIGDRLARVEAWFPDRLKREQKAEQPRQVNIRITKAADLKGVDIYQMANLPFSLISQQGGKTYSSSRVDFKGRVGYASATVPPGTYTLSMPRFNLRATLVILPNDPNQVSINMHLDKSGVTIRRN